MRNIEWKKHWPFGVHESEKRPSFPPLDVPKFRWWACDICQQTTAPENNDNKDDQTDFRCCSTLHGSDSNCTNSGIQQSPKPESTVVMRDIDLNIPIDLSSNSDFSPIDHEIGLENNINHEVSSISSLEVCPGLAQETHTRKRVHEGDEVSDVEPLTSNVNIEHPTRHLPLELVACSDAVPMGNTSNIFKNDIHDHHLTNSTSKKPPKRRLSTDLLSENMVTRSEQITGLGSASHLPSNVYADSQNLSILPDKVDVQEGMTLIKNGHVRKRKFLPDEESKDPADMCFQRTKNAVQNPDGDARTCDIVPDNRYKDVLVEMSLQNGVKGHQNKPELERSSTMSKKDVVEKEGASIEKGMNVFGLHASRNENEHNISKGKGKMLQADEDLDSLFYWKNEKQVEDAFSHKREKVLSNMPASIPIPSAQGAWNGEGLKERLHLSLNCNSSVEACSKKGICQTKNQMPFSLSEGSSKSHLIREDSEPNISRASRHISNAISRKGKGVHLEEIDGARNKAKTVQFYDLTVEAAEEGANNNVRMEVVDMMARNQYERPIPHVDNRNSLLDKSIQMAKHQTCERTNGIVTRDENMLYGKGNSTNFFYPYSGNQFGLTDLRKTQSPFGLEVLRSKNKPSSGLYFSPIDTRNFGTSRFNRSIAERGSSGAALQDKGGSNVWKSILKNDFNVSRPWPTLIRNNTSMRFDAASRKGFSQPTSRNNFDKFSFQSASWNTIPNMNLLNLTGAGRQSTSSFNASVGARMLQSAFYPGGCSNNLKIGSSIRYLSFIR
ncbi:PREDICTED: uncharacterized protein LOC109357912 [Lupinus angustifolius]|uniref:uncharacterized protein LOC109357912 n=1 Tax=Lupinus angustifolius TaxID=3871 RepID=UPI00092E5CCC|nr:PREDICTED: uncharacterized protein LOC109357912 [Lupinus angustifolius]